jgi:hypothetical protein
MLARSSVGGDLLEFEKESKKWPAFITEHTKRQQEFVGIHRRKMCCDCKNV